MKVIENEKLLIIYTELENEKEISKQHKKIPQEIKLIERRTQQKIQKIKVDVLNIDFSFTEIFN